MKSEDGVKTRIAPVSVVIPCYRCATTVFDAVASIASQTFLPAEVILVDDASGDGTESALRQLAKDHPGWLRTLFRESNSGPSACRNAGWELARNEYVAFLDADDTWHPRKIELQMQVMMREAGISLVAHGMNVKDRHAKWATVSFAPSTRRLRRFDLLWNNPIPTASVLLRRDIPFRFDETRRRAEDYLLWAQIVFSGLVAMRMDSDLASWHKWPFGAGGLSGDIVAMNRAAVDAWETLLRQSLISKPEFAFARSVGYMRALRRRLLIGRGIANPARSKRGVL